MLKKYLLLVFTSLFLMNFSLAQGVCGTYEGSFEEEVKNYPHFHKSLNDINAELELKYKSAINKISHWKTENGKKIIPVVVHVIHDMGSENISDASIQNAIDILNANINGQASNFLSKTPDVFAAVRGDLNVEFRLAKIDPMGQPTTGINRVRSSLTYEPNPRNAVKTLSYWDSFKYFNIWTLKKFLPQDDGNTLLGYAQFPWTGSMSTDGVVLLASQMVSGGTLTHETGHWLGLRHTWGDSDCGDDNVSDTPPAKEANFGVNLSNFPYHVGIPSGSFDGCIADSLNWAGEMFVNYMDYSNDADVTMFTKGQDAVMNETLEGLEGEIGFREYMWQQDNLEATGTTDGYRPPTCSQEADFNFSGGTSPSVCEGERIFLKGNKTQFGNGNVNSFVWDFGNGDTDNTGSNQIQYIYPSEGSYDVTLTIEYNETTQATSYNLSDLDLINATSYDSILTNKIVQGTASELANIGAINPIEIALDSLGVYFGMQDSSYFRGTLQEYEYIAFYANTCISTIKKDDFIVISPTSSSNSNNSYSYSFEGADTLSNANDWSLVPSYDVESIWNFNSAESVSWTHFKNVSSDGNACIGIGANTGFGSHQIISTSYDLSGLTDPAIKFSWSGAAVNTFPVNDLVVSYSSNCGEDWSTLATLSAIDVANSGLYNTEFKPNEDEWKDTLITKNALQDNNIRFRFTYTVNDYSNNFYLDNIKIGEYSSLFDSSLDALSRVSLFPNPSKGGVNISLENMKDKDIEVSLVNILGADVKKLFSGVVLTDFYNLETDVSSFDKGIYFVKVVSQGDIITTEKLILNK